METAADSFVLGRLGRWPGRNAPDSPRLALYFVVRLRAVCGSAPCTCRHSSRRCRCEFEQFSVNAPRPNRDYPGTSAESDLGSRGDDGASGLSVPSLPSPEQAEASAVPGNDRFGFHDDQAGEGFDVCRLCGKRPGPQADTFGFRVNLIGTSSSYLLCGCKRFWRRTDAQSLDHRTALVELAD